MELENKLAQLSATDLLNLSQVLNKVIAQMEEAKGAAWRIRQPNTAYEVGDTVIVPGAGNFYKVMKCGTAGTTGPDELDYAAILESGNSSFADGTAMWTISELVTIPSIPEAPVTSVNKQTGDVNVNCATIGALPVAGGTLTGPIRLAYETLDTTEDPVSIIATHSASRSTALFSHEKDNVFVYAMGGSDVYNGASMLLCGSNYGGMPGWFRFSACPKNASTATELVSLIGTPEGALTWKGKHVARTVNGVDANINGYIGLHKAIGRDTNLNDYVELLTYFCISDAYAMTLQNCPVKYAFCLEVLSYPDCNILYQRLTCFHDNSVYVRRRYNGAWTAWQQLVIAQADGTLKWNSKDITLGYPNYAAGVAPGEIDTYTAADDGWMLVYNRVDSPNRWVTVNGFKVFYYRGIGWTGDSCLFPVKKGDVIKSYTGDRPDTTKLTPIHMIFYPNR